MLEFPVLLHVGECLEFASQMVRPVLLLHLTEESSGDKVSSG
jgi:hypothetical protein